LRALQPVRLARTLPKDDKLTAGLNGLALSAFSQAAALDPGYRLQADRLQAFLLAQLVRDGKLIKARSRGQVLPHAELEDYAYVVQGLLDHADATGNGVSRTRARELAQVAWQTFWSDKGWRLEASPLLATLQPQPALADGALYSPSEVLLLSTLRIPDAALQRMARTAAGWNVPAMEQDAYLYPTRLRLLTQAAS
ncbi:MAG: thioredoxin domain-containing protein, partial [Planctomycetota bacterium]